MGQETSTIRPEARSRHEQANYLVNKHPPVKRRMLDDISPTCKVCKLRKIVEEMPKQKVKTTVVSGKVRNRWDEMGNESRAKMPWKATCY